MPRVKEEAAALKIPFRLCKRLKEMLQHDPEASHQQASISHSATSEEEEDRRRQPHNDESAAESGSRSSVTSEEAREGPAAQPAGDLPVAALCPPLRRFGRGRASLVRTSSRVGGRTVLVIHTCSSKRGRTIQSSCRYYLKGSLPPNTRSIRCAWPPTP